MNILRRRRTAIVCMVVGLLSIAGFCMGKRYTAKIIKDKIKDKMETSTNTLGIEKAKDKMRAAEGTIENTASKIEDNLEQYVRDSISRITYIINNPEKATKETFDDIIQKVPNKSINNLFNQIIEKTKDKKEAVDIVVRNTINNKNLLNKIESNLNAKTGREVYMRLKRKTVEDIEKILDKESLNIFKNNMKGLENEVIDKIERNSNDIDYMLKTYPFMVVRSIKDMLPQEAEEKLKSMITPERLPLILGDLMGDTQTHIIEKLMQKKDNLFEKTVEKMPSIKVNKMLKSIANSTAENKNVLLNKIAQNVFTKKLLESVPEKKLESMFQIVIPNLEEQTIERIRDKLQGSKDLLNAFNEKVLHAHKSKTEEIVDYVKSFI